MLKSRRSILAAAGLLSLAFGGTALADGNDGGWWPRWGMGRGMMDGYGWGGGMMGYGPDS